MTTPRYQQLGCPLELISVESCRADVDRHTPPPRLPKLLHTFRSSACNSSFLAFLSLYLLGEDAEIREAADDHLRHAEQYFFGDWKSQSPSGNGYEKPPNPEYWNQMWAQDEAFVHSAAVASLTGDWKFVDRVAEYIAAIKWETLEVPGKPGLRWIDIEDGREESAWRMILANVISGSGDPDATQPLRNIVLSGRERREKLLLEFLDEICRGDDTALQAAADLYFDYHRRTESKSRNITVKAAIEGTLLVNYAFRRGRRIMVDGYGARYISLPEK